MKRAAALAMISVWAFVPCPAAGLRTQATERVDEPPAPIQNAPGWSTATSGVGFERASVPDAEGKPLDIAIWYPTSAPVSPQPFGPFMQTVAIDGPILGTHLPLVLISHGTSGTLWSHYDTALELARAGFVVAALLHIGDNYQDQSYAGNQRNLVDRPRQVHRVLDYILASWTGHTHLDSTKVGIFGFSLGGFTALVVSGGTPDLRQFARLCADRPSAPECGFIRSRHGDQLDTTQVLPVTWVHDARVRAAVVAAPAVAFTFGSTGGGLRMVTIPVQLWRAENDDQAPNAWNSNVVIQGLPTPPEQHTVAGAGHLAFLTPCNQALATSVPSICRDGPNFDRVAFHQRLNQQIVQFFRANLGGTTRD